MHWHSLPRAFCTLLHDPSRNKDEARIDRQIPEGVYAMVKSIPNKKVSIRTGELFQADYVLASESPFT